MSISFGLSPLSEEIVASYARLFPEEAAYKGSTALSWRFTEGPQPGFFAVARDLENEGQIVGLIGLIATKLRVDGALRQGYQAIDTVVDPRYRGRGLFVGLGRAAHDNLPLHGGEILWGFPNANAAPGWFGRLRWSNFGEVPFLIRPLRSGYFLRKLYRRLGGIDLPMIRSRRNRDAAHREISRFQPKDAGMLHSFQDRVSCGVVRDVEYLNWRLQSRPKHRYRTTGCYDEGGALIGFVSIASAEKHGGRIVYIMEVLASPEGELATANLLRNELARSAAAGAEVALAWCPQDAPNRHLYGRAGFFALPERLRPIAIHFGAKELLPSGREHPLRKEGWYLSYLDSDTV